jgi:mRNA interferase MazF
VISDFGDVVVVPFPFVDMPVAKRRPALVLSNAGFNAANGQTALAMITSARHAAWPTDIEIEDLSAAGLAHASSIRWKLFTLPNDLVVRVVGKLGSRDANLVGIATQRHLAPAA